MEHQGRRRLRRILSENAASGFRDLELTSRLIDTSAYSWALRDEPTMRKIFRTADRLCLPVVVLGELLAGFKMGAQEMRNRALLQRFLDSPRVEVLSVTEATSEQYAGFIDHLRAAGTPIPTNDVWIAAVAAEHKLTLVTTDFHFSRVPRISVELIEPKPC